MPRKTDAGENYLVDTRSGLDSEERHRRIAEAAYYRAQRRGFAPGYEEEDWLAAEKELEYVEGGEETEFHAEDNYFPSPK